MKFTKALVVDDSKVVRIKLGRVLEARQFKVDSVASGQEALEYLKTSQPDIIFMDFMMPDMDGFEVTGIITKDPAISHIPVIMCTGQDTPEERARADENGASGFLTKPVEEEALDALIKTLEEKVAATKQMIAATHVAPSVSPVDISSSENLSITQETIPTDKLIEPVDQGIAEQLILENQEMSDDDEFVEASEEGAGLRVEAVSEIASDVAEEIAQTVLENAMEEILEAVREIAQEAAQAAIEEALDNFRLNLQTENQNLQAQIEENVVNAVQDIMAEQANTLEENRLASEKEIEDQTVEAIQAALEESEKVTDQKLNEVLDSLQELATTTASNTVEQGQEDIRNYIEQAISEVRSQLEEGGNSNVESTATTIAETIVTKSERKLLKAIEAASTSAKEAALEKIAAFAKAQEEQIKNALDKKEGPNFLQDPILLSWLGGVTCIVLFLAYKVITMH